MNIITLTYRLEAILNSPLLTLLSNDPTDLTALKPGHVLICQPLVALSEADIGEATQKRLTHWRQMQSFTQQLGKYHQTLQGKVK